MERCKNPYNKPGSSILLKGIGGGSWEEINEENKGINFFKSPQPPFLLTLRILLFGVFVFHSMKSHESVSSPCFLQYDLTLSVIPYFFREKSVFFNNWFLFILIYFRVSSDNYFSLTNPTFKPSSSACLINHSSVQGRMNFISFKQDFFLYHKMFKYARANYAYRIMMHPLHVTVVFKNLIARLRSVLSLTADVITEDVLSCPAAKPASILFHPFTSPFSLYLIIYHYI